MKTLSQQDLERAESLYASAFYYGDISREHWLSILVGQFAAVRRSAVAQLKAQGKRRTSVRETQKEAGDA